MICTAKIGHYNSIIKSSACYPMQLFKTVKNLLHQSGSAPFPAAGSLGALTSCFQDFFIDRVSKIHSGLVHTDEAMMHLTDPVILPAQCELDSFRPVTVTEMKKLLSKAPPKSCELDPIPTWLLKQCGDELAPTMTDIINLSLRSGVAPDSFKLAHVRPLLKKPGLDTEDMKKYRPVSNLSFLSKLVERVVASRLVEHMAEFDLHGTHQFRYRSHHSCETALIRVEDEVLRAMDNQKVSILLHLDLSAAFDAVSDDVLLGRLGTDLGLRGSALNWFRSYLTDRRQRVSIGGVFSDPRVIRMDVPQSSVLGPQLFSIYTRPIGGIIRSHGLHGLRLLRRRFTDVYICRACSGSGGWCNGQL